MAKEANPVLPHAGVVRSAMGHQHRDVHVGEGYSIGKRSHLAAGLQLDVGDPCRAHGCAKAESNAGLCLSGAHDKGAGVELPICSLYFHRVTQIRIGAVGSVDFEFVNLIR
ncbi:MAG: hypothetical protein BWY82_01051 [Verrucomicrobia bacterium ADurb.Bin474]|nr:MAG: hypothetical protein BWY82_01051 [Verrucomicrobia bacterium ADurb.Bin474]